MRLTDLLIINYKNIEQAELRFSPNVNCLLGYNGMGKTNLLDAIYYLSFCKSFSHLPDSQNMHHEADFFMLQGNYTRQGEAVELHCGMKRRQKKQFKRDKKEYERLSDHIGFVPLVMVSPEDGELIKGASEERRKFLDLVISQSDKSYLNTLIQYNKALQQRNALLKQENTDPTLYDIWEEQMHEAGTTIHRMRQEFIASFIPVFQEFYHTISLGNEQVGLSYTSHCDTAPLHQLLCESRKRDLILGHTTKGIHRDDLESTLDLHPMKRIGSQGQNKTFLIALKLAQFDFLCKNGTTTPLLLLDDIFDKLDAKRVEEIIKLVSSDRFGQIFITDTNREYLDQIIEKIGSNYKLFSVANGEIETMQEGGATIA